MTGRRRELADSLRLLADEERWVVVDLVLGALAAVIWIAGTAAITTQVADAVGSPTPFGPDGGWTTPTLVALVGLWVLVPAAAGAVRVRSRLLNIRGNVEQHYRFDSPAVLLAPPLVPLAVSAIAAVALADAPWYLFALAVPAALYFLVRTLAYSYRVYAVSRPLALHAALFASLVVGVGGVLAFAAVTTGRRGLAEGALLAAGVTTRVLGTVAVGPVDVPVPLGLAVATPVAFALAYLVLQTLGAVVVRLVQPDVDGASMRSGQRYPPFLDATPVSPGPAASSPAAGGAGTDAQTDDAESTEATDDAGGDDESDPDDDFDDVSNTRVFTPPAGDDAFDAVPDAGDGTGGPNGDDGADADPLAAAGSDDAGAGFRWGQASAEGDDGAADADTGTAGGVSTSETRRCDACGETFTVDTAVRFCPNCGAALGE